MSQNNVASRFLAISFIGILIASAVYIYIYQFQPLPETTWNDQVLYLFNVFASSLAAAVATAVAWRFAKDEPPRGVWDSFALGLWVWAVAELIWVVYAQFYEQVPDLTLADLFWVGAYVFFAVALLRQYRLVSNTPRRVEIFWGGVVVLGLLGLITAITVVLERLDTATTWSETFLGFFYPCADLAVAVAALNLSRLFGRGAWGRVWLGLVVFAVADTLYSWLTISGLYAYSLESGNLLSLIADTLYFDAYLIVAWVCYAQLLLLRHGPARSRSVEWEIGE